MNTGLLIEKIDKIYFELNIKHDPCYSTIKQILYDMAKEFPRFPESERAKDFARYSINADDWFEKWFGDLAFASYGKSGEVEKK
jgi:hypothetical protein